MKNPKFTKSRIRDYNTHMDRETQGIQNLIEIPSDSRLVTLRQFSLADAQHIFKLINKSREHLSQFGDETAAKYPTLRSVEDSITNPKNPKRLRFGVWSNKNVLVGSINLTPDENNPKRAEIGYYLGAKHMGKGYMTEAVITLTEWAFSYRGFKELYAKVHKDNAASAKVLLKSEFKETGRDKDEIIFTLMRGKQYDV